VPQDKTLCKLGALQISERERGGNLIGDIGVAFKPDLFEDVNCHPIMAPAPMAVTPTVFKKSRLVFFIG